MGKNKNKKQQAENSLLEKENEVADTYVAQPQPQAEDNSFEVFLWLLAYSVLMFTLPFLGFYGVQNWLQESFPNLTVFEVNCYSVLTAVLVANAIVAMYVFKAIREKDPPPLEGEQDESKKEQ
ncbi:uncharacterized protein Dwil_GK27099 [Drosophila willistoni]|uniref:Vacuolar ATPase assembly integral membrane protein VMA21 homolog n=1 Tax=Drosophila willistoni TaxID=7260 RepID=A0A0Q9X3A6_DROWI|nr:uncharacterized protein LOC26529101 [Drosophila willistoni]KRG00004.1 uncharacterized protein Dwil_GK27099 [Drosophila willistoni]